MSSTSMRRLAAPLSLAVLALSLGCASMGGVGGVSGGEPAAPPTTRTIALNCGEQYVWIPFEQVVMLEVTGSDCWTDWATIPPQARGISLRAQGVLDVQLAFGDGKTASHTDVAPTRRLPDVERATGIRYRNRQGRAVRVELALR